MADSGNLKLLRINWNTRKKEQISSKSFTLKLVDVQKNEDIYEVAHELGTGNFWNYNKYSSSIGKYPIKIVARDSVFSRYFCEDSIQG